MLAQGLSEQTGIGIGEMTVIVSGIVLLSWIPLGTRPGLGTVMNAILIGVALGVMVEVVNPPDGLALRYGAMLGGIVLVGIGSGIYLTCRLGPGPRDGLMTGLHYRTGRSLRLVRTGIETSATAAGFVLGGTVGIGTLAFAFLIGPFVQLFVRIGGGLAPPEAIGE